MLLTIIAVIISIIVIYYFLNSPIFDKIMNNLNTEDSESVNSETDTETIENFVPYKRKPYNYWSTGADPLNYYRLPAYRKPYRYPYKYHTSYPYDYNTYYPLNL